MSKPVLKINFGAKKVPVLDKEERAKQQIERAKQNGLDEMEKFTIAYDKFHQEVKDLAIYKDAIDQIEFSVDSLTDNVLRPVLLGKDISGFPDDVYNKIRLDVFKALIKKYEGDKK